MGRGKRKAICIIAAMAAVATMVGCATEEEPVPEITDVYAIGVETEYDGLAHGIVIKNLIATDTVYYKQADGSWDTAVVEYTIPGEYTVEYSVERTGYKTFTDSATVKIVTGVLPGISSAARTEIYDGQEYGIELSGTAVTDIISYSADGNRYRSEPVLYSEVGEYTVYYRVERGYSEYKGSGKLTILPDVRGEYINTLNGIITVTGTTAIIDEREFTMTYGIDGKGEIDGEAIEINDGVLTYAENEYEKKGAEDKVYRIVINGTKYYALGGAVAELEITFEQDIGTVTVDGEEIARIAGVNYCESSDAEEVRIELTEDAEIELSKREEQTVAEEVKYVVYDGEKHGYETDYDGEVLYLDANGEHTKKSPEFDEIGRYETQAVYKKDGFLPAEITVVLEIVARIAGVYCNSDTVIQIADSKAKINGAEVTVEFERGEWIINGEGYVLSDGKLKNATTGNEYAAAEQAMRIAIGEEITVITYKPTQLTITLTDGVVTVTDGERELARGEIAGETKVEVNGKEITCIDIDGAKEYGLGMDDLKGNAVIITVSGE